jgi:hypothetical protein
MKVRKQANTLHDVEVQKIWDEDYPAGKLRYYWKSLNLRRLSDEAISDILECTEKCPSALSTVDIWHLGGAISGVSAEETAFSSRQVPYLLNVEANWSTPQDDVANIGWTRQFIEQMQSFSDGGRYLNFPGFLEEGEAAMRASFGHNYDRLIRLKSKYDPTNLFRQNQNIRPTVS